MGGLQVGAFLSGAAQGYDKAVEERRQKERDDREKKRFEFEQKEMERKDAERQRQEAIRGQLEELDKARMSGTGDFAQFADPDRVAAAQQQTGGIAGPGGAPKQDSTTAFFKADQLYRDPKAAEDMYYSKLGSLLRQDYANKGDLGRAAMVDTEIEKMREVGYDRTRKAAAAAVLAGASPEAVQPLLERAYSTIQDGRTVSVTGAKTDPKTGAVTYDLAFKDKDGRTVNQAISQVGLFGMLQQASPFEVLKYNTERAEFKEGVRLKERGLDIEQQKASNLGAYYSSRAKAEADAEKGASQRARTEALIKMFPNANEVDEAKLMLKPEAEQKRIRADMERDRMGLDMSVQLSGMNPRIDPRTIASFVKQGGRGTVEQDENGPYTTFAGQKIYVPSNKVRPVQSGQ